MSTEETGVSVETMAFSESQVCYLTGLKTGRLRYWFDMFTPSISSDSYRLYGFRDIVGLRVCKKLRDDGVSRQEIRKVHDYLVRYSQTPWSSLTLYRLGKHVLFRNPESGRIEATNPEQQQTFDEIIQFESVATELRREIQSRRQRGSTEVGHIKRTKGILGNEWVIEGTRIPASAIWNYHEDGATEAQILQQFPSLTAKDVRAAIAWGKKRSGRRAS